MTRKATRYTATYDPKNETRKRNLGYFLPDGCPLKGQVWIDRGTLPDGQNPPQSVTITVQFNA